MRIFLTGGRGMVGRNILEHPQAKEYQWLTPNSTELDLCDYASVLRWLQQQQPDFIIHAAGRVGGIQANMREPVSFLLDNLDMGRNIVWAARNVGIRQIINLGSSCMYPRNAPNPLSEEMILQGELEPTNEGYALAKITTAKLCQYISQETPEYRYKTLVPCNIYGRYDKFSPVHSHMVPAILHKLHTAKTNIQHTVDIWGDGNARREFMYAGDLADCILRAIGNFDTLPPLINIGLGHDWTVNEYYAVAAKVVGYNGIFNHDLDKPVGMQQKLVSTNKLDAWGWRSKTSLIDGLTATYEYYLQSTKHQL